MMTKLFNLIQRFLFDKKLYQYIGAGAIAASVDIGTFIFLTKKFQTHYLILATVSFVIATLVNYLLCAFVVFKHAARYSSQAALFLTYFVSFVGLCIHHSMLMIGFELLALPLVLAKVIAMGIAFFWNYLSRKYWVFAQTKMTPSSA